MKLFIQMPRRNRSLLCRFLFAISVLYVLAAFFSREDDGPSEGAEAEQAEAAEPVADTVETAAKKAEVDDGLSKVWQYSIPAISSEGRGGWWAEQGMTVLVPSSKCKIW